MADNPYDPVTTTDSTQLTDDDWNMSLSSKGYSRFSRTSRFKTLCNVLHRHNKTIMITSVALLVAVLVVIIIAVAASHDSERHPTGDEGKWESPEQGLVFYPMPEDKSIVISFTPNDFHSSASQPIKKSLDNIMYSYHTAKQLNEDYFIDCNRSYNPANKTCRVTRDIFGDICTSGQNYGYLGGQPCVFIQLNLPEGVTIKPIQDGSKLWKEAKSVIENQPDPSYVPVTCRGTESLDTEILESVRGFGPKGERIMYYPNQGLLSYLYRKRDASLPFLKPGIMVQFTSLVSRRKVHITCTAWGQLYDSQNRMIDHKLLTTHFALYANHE